MTKNDHRALPRALRDHLDLTRADLALILDVSTRSVERFENNGNIGSPTVVLLKLLLVLAQQGQEDVVRRLPQHLAANLPAALAGDINPRELTPTDRLDDLAGWLEHIGRELDDLLPKAEAEGLRVDRVGRAQFAAEAAAGQLRAVLASRAE